MLQSVITKKKRLKPLEKNKNPKYISVQKWPRVFHFLFYFFYYFVSGKVSRRSLTPTVLRNTTTQTGEI